MLGVPEEVFPLFSDAVVDGGFTSVYGVLGTVGVSEASFLAVGFE